MELASELSEYAVSLRYRDLSEHAVHIAKQRLIDCRTRRSSSMASWTRHPPRRGFVRPDTTAAAAVQLPAAGSYQLDPDASTVTFATRHMFGLAPVKGTFRLVSGQITIADPVTSSTVSAVIDAASFATSNPQRDKDVSPECRTADQAGALNIQARTRYASDRGD